MALVYPNKAGIDSWAAMGNKGWDWDGLAPYYRKFQTLHYPSPETRTALSVDYLDKNFQGQSGPIQASFPDFVGPVAGIWPETFKNLNHTASGDPMSGNVTGGLTTPASVDPKTKERSYAASGYYAPASSRPNLHLMTETMVEKITLQRAREGLVATGVQFSCQGKRQTLAARKEVILAAGVIQTPQLLELSGIGSSELLPSLGIEVKVSNPYVGENLQDHPLTGLSLEVNDGIPTTDMIRDPAVVQAAMEAYQTAKAGPLTASFNSLAFMPLIDAIPGQSKAELGQLLDNYLNSEKMGLFPSQKEQFQIFRSILETPGEATIILAGGTIQMHLNKEHASETFTPTDPGNYMCFCVFLPYPFSRGSVHIKSTSPYDHPAIDPRYLSHPLDAEILGRHMLYLDTIAATPPLSSILKPNGRRIPSDPLGNLDEAKEYVKRNFISGNHQCGTCAMLPREKGGVVDDRLRVYGVKNLRVVDASVFPLAPRGNIQTSVYAVAEKAADLIKEDYRSS